MSDVEKLLKLGSSLGHSGDDLNDWVTTQVAEQDKQRQAEIEKLKLEREKLRDQQQLMDKEMELLRLRMEHQQSATPPSTPWSIQESGGQMTRSAPAKSPRLPCFEEKTDQIDSYLLRFERYASVNEWPRADWAIHLSALLRGKALEVYSRLHEEDAMDYDKVRDALLKRYNLTQDGFQEKFRKSRPESGESMSQFRTRIHNYLDKWVHLAGKDIGQAEDIVDLMMMEQLMNTCSRDLLVFLRERKPKSADALVDMAEKYIEAHGATGAYSKAGPERKQEPHSKPYQTEVNLNRQVIKCHKCKRMGHFAKDCRTHPVSVVRSDTMLCGYCGRRNHTEDRCWLKKRTEGQKSKTAGAIEFVKKSSVTSEKSEEEMTDRNLMVSATCTGYVTSSPKMPIAEGYLDGKKVTVLRDSGCSTVVVKKGLCKKAAPRGNSLSINLADGTPINAPTTTARLDCPFYSGEVKVVEIESPLYDVILGNIPGAKCPGIKCNEETMAVETRNKVNKAIKALVAPPSQDTGITVELLIEKQQQDDSLSSCRKCAETGEVRHTGKDNKTWFGHDKGILFRYFQSPVKNHGDVSRQVVVPKDLRQTVMSLAHESIMAGHLAAKKTIDRVLQDFYWPNMWADVNRFCRSCDKCQRCAPKGQVGKVPLSKVPLIDEPFSRIAVDIVGPIIPASDRGNRYILTVVDYCTRFPEAVALKSVDTEQVAEALVDIFSRTGVPKEMLTDRGTQFTSDMMKEVCRLLSLRRLTTTPYHPQCNGLVERLNGTLKGMLKRLAADRPKDWDRYINAALFAYREVPQESLGFSPFELLYARPVRGPMTILRELWTQDIADEEIKTTYQYVVDLKSKMEQVIDMAHENLRNASGRYKAHFDRKTKARSFEEGDRVLLLLPTKANKLQLKWQGPFKVLKRVGENNYVIDVGRSQKTYHANMLKKYWDREGTEDTQQEKGTLHCVAAALINEDEECENAKGSGKPLNDLKIETPNLQQTETYHDVVLNQDLDSIRQEEMLSVLEGYKDVLTDVPGRTNVYVYDIKLTSSTPVRRRPYPTPQALQADFCKEVRAMLDAGIIEPSESPYSSPPVIVKKKDGKNRYCVDYRLLNNVSVFDAEPMPQLDDLFQKIGKESNFVSKIDLSKGYWQVPLSDRSKPLTAFPTELGLMQFTVMPFGLQCAPAAFSRMMRKVIGHEPNVKNYIDDIIIHNASWEEHILTVKKVLDKLRRAGLTAKPSKCSFGFSEVEFLGHKIGNGALAPTIDKVQAIKGAKPPQNKKQLRSFLGLASFYRRYVPNFSALVSPLTDATRKHMPNRIIWAEPQERAFNKLKQVLTSDPVLSLPDFSRQFILSTDASDTGVGAILFQEYEGEKRPVVYLSRKLLPREQNYSVVEKECLALVWAVKSLSSYLLGREFLVETDHAPLLYLNRAKSENGRLMRWALLLNQYRFSLRAVRGCDNHGPDFLSRTE